MRWGGHDHQGAARVLALAGAGRTAHERREDQRDQVPEDKRARFEERFKGRAGAVENTPGFEWFELLRPVEGTDQYLVYTRWENEEAYQSWQSGRTSTAPTTAAATPSPRPRRGPPPLELRGDGAPPDRP